LKVIDIIHSLLPFGTDGTSLELRDGTLIPRTINYLLCPVWPPDVFAVAGTIIEKSGCYTLAGPDRDNLAVHQDYLRCVTSIADTWRTDPTGLFAPPDAVTDLWKQLLSFFDVELIDVCRNQELCQVLFRLFAIADEACVGVGWDVLPGLNIFADFARFSFIQNTVRPPKSLPHAPHSLCALISPQAAIVLPKTLTATVGCTVRSLSHHLALLPGITQVQPSWALASVRPAPESTEPVNLLVVPFPYKIKNESFYVSADPKPLHSSTQTAAYFGLDQQWLYDDSGTAITANQVLDELLLPLITEARKKTRHGVHGIVIPECALSEELADALAIALVTADIHFFVTGILSKDVETGKPRNIAKTYVIDKANMGVVPLEQSKHHRWRLNVAQNEQYALDFHSKSHANKWWEDIDVSERKLPFFAFRRDMSMAVLICEDLARSDPAMSVIRAVGPNLVLALLMDGPQIPQRWPGRYATVLAEDPGSAVLTVSCTAMVDRSNSTFIGSSKKRAVGLWRDTDENMQAIELEDKSVAVMLTLKPSIQKQHTLDARSDNFSCHKLTLDQVCQISIEERPTWL
jgi:hypothetical protein